METQTKNHRQGETSCQNCKNSFIIESDDFAFYEKIKVPPPTFCPKCRAVRRMNNTNERALYFRNCDLTGKKIMSMFPKDAPFPVFDTEAWYSDDWDPYQYGQEYDFSKPFFEQFLELQNKVPRMALVRQGNSINSDYCHRIDSPKNCYMVFRATRPEECMYSYVLLDAKECIDCSYLTKCELCYECVDCENCYGLKHSQESTNCRTSDFLYGCHNLSDCIGCVNLRNKEYCIFNIQYSKEEYLEKKKEFKLDTYDGLKNFTNSFEKFRKEFPIKAIASLKSSNVSGNWFSNCQNVSNSYFCINIKDGKNLLAVFNAQDCMDYFQWGNAAELVYESENCGINISKIFSCSQCWMGAYDLAYCDSCPGASYCFGCIGLKKGEYSILNKRYSKEEYEQIIPKIKQHMVDMPYTGNNNRIYSFGEHFPFEISPFAYNETAAIDFFPITKEEALKMGYKWKDREKNTYIVTKKPDELSQTISEVDDSIISEVIECADKEKEYSAGAFKVTTEELFLYKKMNIPLPRKSFGARFIDRLNKRPKMEIIKRKCSKCNVDIETVYSEDFAPIVFCEQCYQKEVL
jgi:hypothetical protein